MKGQSITLILNVLMMFLWYARLVYLNSDVSAENERYLMNYQYLSGFVSKPRKSYLQIFTNKFATNSVFSILLGLGFLSLILFAIKKITLFLLLNTAFILIVVILALFFGIRSIKRDWQNQIGLFIKNKQDD
jgi:NADH:ubiquinone oxidoreductase subunit 3 (subunit A)